MNMNGKGEGDSIMKKSSLIVCCVFALLAIDLLIFPENAVSQPEKNEKRAEKTSDFLKKLETALSNRIDEYRDDPENKWGTWMSNMKERLEKREFKSINQLTPTEKMRLLYLYHDYRIDQLKNKVGISSEKVEKEKYKREFARLTLEIERKIYKLEDEFNLNLKTKGEKKGYGDVYKRAKKIKERLIRKTIRRSSKSEILSSLKVMVEETQKAEEKKLLERLNEIKVKISEEDRKNLTLEEKEAIAVSLIRKKILNREKSEVERGRVAGRLLKIRNLRELIGYLEGLRSLKDKPFIREVSAK